MRPRALGRDIQEFTVKAVAGREAAVGLRLAGLETSEVEDSAQGTTRLEALLERPDVGVVLVEDSVHQGLDEDLLRGLARRVLPMVVPFPGPGGTEGLSGAEAYIVEMLRQAIGYRVRLR